MSDVFNQLFSHVAAERLTSFSCGHIIPASNLQTLVVTKGPKGSPLELKAERQKDPAAVSTRVSPRNLVSRRSHMLVGLETMLIPYAD